MKYILLIISLSLISCSTMDFKKGKLKKTKEISYRCYRDKELYYVVKSNDHYKLGNKIYVTEEQFKLFDKINPKDKEEYLLYLIESGRMNMMYKFNTVDISEELNKEINKKIHINN